MLKSEKIVWKKLQNIYYNLSKRWHLTCFGVRPAASAFVSVAVPKTNILENHK